MRMTYISKIQANLKRYQTVHARKATTRVLDGSYKSVFKGRSMNFDELREYVPGDDIKDIDWKASSRSQKMLVRQYIAERKHNIMLVFDTNRRMLGDSDGLEEKRELAIMSAGTMAYFVNRNGDFVSATYATEKSVKHFPFKTGLGNIELILENYQRDVTMENHSDINTALEYIIRNFKRKMIILVVTDVAGIRSVTDTNLKRLLVAHDLLFLSMSDAALSGKKVYGIDGGSYYDSFFTRDKKLAKHTKERNLAMQNEATEKLMKYGIPCSTIDYLDELDREIIDLLEKHKLTK